MHRTRVLVGAATVALSLAALSGCKKSEPATDTAGMTGGAMMAPPPATTGMSAGATTGMSAGATAKAGATSAAMKDTTKTKTKKP